MHDIASSAPIRKLSTPVSPGAGPSLCPRASSHSTRGGARRRPRSSRRRTAATRRRSRSARRWPKGDKRWRRGAEGRSRRAQGQPCPRRRRPSAPPPPSWRTCSPASPTSPPTTCPMARTRRPMSRSSRWGTPRDFDFAAEGTRRSRPGAGDGFRDRRGDCGRALHLPARPHGAAAPRARAVHARPADGARTATPNATRRCW